MSLNCLSFSHHHVSIDFRERVYFDHNAIANACARFQCGQEKLADIHELSILSTCNRTEIYSYSAGEIPATGREQIKRTILNFVSEARGVDVDLLASNGQWHSGPSAIDHLFRVACGLESLVPGEPQILGQVGDAMRLGLIMNATGPVLSQMFRAALKSGRRARIETEIGKHSLNISTVAVNTAERELGNLQGKSVVVLGAGDMADLALAQLVKKGVASIHIVNRTIAKARELADQHAAKPHVFEQINEILPIADILITSTGAPHTLVSVDMIHHAMQMRPEQRMMILDIALPRDVDSSVSELANVHLCDIDDLHLCTGQSARIRESQIPHVEQLIQADVDRFMSWFRSIGIESTIAALRRQAETTRHDELERLFRLLPELSVEQAGVIEQFSKSFANKLLHHPTNQLREQEGTRNAVDYGAAIRELFLLEPEPEAEPVEVRKE